MFLIDKLKKITKKEDEKTNFEIVANEWLEYKRNMVKESTYYHYLQIVEKYLKPQFIDLNFNETINYNEFIQELSTKLSSKTVRDIIIVLKAILKYYEEENECVLKIKKSSVPKLEKKQVKILTKREKTKIKNYCLKNKTLKNIGIVMCLNTGLRIGEICSLKWENIDLEGKKIYIKQTIERIYNKKENKSKIIINTPKTQSSIRIIPISKKLYNILEPLKKNYKEKDFFLSGKEKYIEPRSYQYTFKEILKKLKIKPKKFHCLRHTFATDCLEVGMDIKSLSEVLGHSDINVTLKVYVHSSDKLKKKYLEKL